MSIYLDGIFSYHQPFTSPTAPKFPIVTQEELKTHVEFILSTSNHLLDQGCAGIILFFPLRLQGRELVIPPLSQRFCYY
jgi:hypothetical protein